MIQLQEFLGRIIKVKNSSDITKTGLEGIIVNETKNMFYIRTKSGIKSIPKKDTVFCVLMEKENKWYDLNGNTIAVRPEDRIKLFKKK